MVTSITTSAGNGLDKTETLPHDRADLAPYFLRYAVDELRTVVAPRLLRLRRLVIGEVGRFPELAEALFENGPRRSIRSLTSVITELAQRGPLTAPDPLAAATTLNWLVLAEPINAAMLLGDEAIPSATAMRTHAREAIRVFLAAYGSCNVRKACEGTGSIPGV